MSRAKSSDYFGQRLQDGQADALSALYSAVAAAVETDPSSVPCVGSRAHLWTDPRPSAIRHAAAACQTCPLIKQCGRYARTFGETSGVWGGRSRGATSYQQTEIAI